MALYFVIRKMYVGQLFIIHNLFVMKVTAALAGGLAGTVTVASLHEAFRRITPDAPRMDILDMELIRKGLRSINKKALGEEELQRWAVAGELVCDTVYYGLTAVGSKRGRWFRGTLLGLIAGVTAVILPKSFGLSTEPSNKTLGTQLMTIGLYLTGGLVAAATMQLVDNAESNNEIIKEVY